MAHLTNLNSTGPRARFSGSMFRREPSHVAQRVAASKSWQAHRAQEIAKHAANKTKIMQYLAAKKLRRSARMSFHRQRMDWRMGRPRPNVANYKQSFGEWMAKRPTR